MEEMAQETLIQRLTERQENTSDNRILFQKIGDRWLQRSEHVMNKLGKVITNTNMHQNAGDRNSRQTEDKLNRCT